MVFFSAYWWRPRSNRFKTYTAHQVLEKMLKCRCSNANWSCDGVNARGTCLKIRRPQYALFADEQNVFMSVNAHWKCSIEGCIISVCVLCLCTRMLTGNTFCYIARTHFLQNISSTNKFFRCFFLSVASCSKIWEILTQSVKQ